MLLYRELARHLGTEQPFYGLQAQGLDGKIPFYTSIEEMAAHYLAEIRAVQPEGPYFLGGYCMGGTLAYHIAQELLAREESPGWIGSYGLPRSTRVAPRPGCRD